MSEDYYDGQTGQERIDWICSDKVISAFIKDQEKQQETEGIKTEDDKE
ncbi:MAG: hypothetical protein ACOC5T_02080 [Elusimicrobiota bacterium]